MHVCLFKLTHIHTENDTKQTGGVFKTKLPSHRTRLFAAGLSWSSLSLLQDISSDLRLQRSLISDTEQNLRSAKSSCENMANKFQEHCPDIERQEADVQKLSKRYNNLNSQIDSR